MVHMYDEQSVEEHRKKMLRNKSLSHLTRKERDNR